MWCCCEDALQFQALENLPWLIKTIISILYQKIPKENIQASVRDLNLKHSGIMQAKNYKRHKSTFDFHKRNKMKVL